MQEPVPGAPANDPIVFGPSGRALLTVAKILAILGGLLFVGLVAMSIVSIVGRKLMSAPVPGDVELLQMIAAAASAAFFAYCHLNHGDVKVDFFTAAAPPWPPPACSPSSSAPARGYGPTTSSSSASA